MHLTLTNVADEPEAIAAPDGSFANALNIQTAYALRDKIASVRVIGDKPDVNEQVQRAAALLADTAQVPMMTTAGRKQHVLRRVGKARIGDRGGREPRREPGARIARR